MIPPTLCFFHPETEVVECWNWKLFLNMDLQANKSSFFSVSILLCFGTVSLEIPKVLVLALLNIFIVRDRTLNNLYRYRICNLIVET